MIGLPHPRSAQKALDSFNLFKLESRLLLSGTHDWLGGAARIVSEADGGPTLLRTIDLVDVQKTIVAGDPNGTPPDAPANRIDPNTIDSPWVGVGSLSISTSQGNFICSATAIGPRHVLTAGHCVDIDNNGVVDVAPSGLTFNLNIGGDLTHQIVGSAVYLHPDFTGFSNPLGTINDDIAVIELSEALPASVPIYPISTTPLTGTPQVTLVGYGTTGDGVNGYIDGSASFTTRRVGGNVADIAELDDEGSGTVEIFRFDFDDPADPSGLGNDVETTYGGGDSGGPTFIPDGTGGWMLFGVNTHTFSFSFLDPPAPLFGSGGGGMVVAAYADFILPIISPVQITESGGATAVREDGATDTYSVVLDSPPAADVTVAITPDLQVTTDATTLTFTPGDWDVAQTVTVSAVDDAAEEGPHTGAITHAIWSDDPLFNSVAARTLTVNITDNDVTTPINAIQDGGFEAGTPNPYWTESSTNFGTPIVDTSAGTGGGLQGPRSGEYWAWFGGINALEIGEVRQIVELNGPTTLEFYLHMPSTNLDTQDWFRVFIDNTEVFRHRAADYPSYFFGYELVSLDLTPFADGQTHNIRFNGVTFGDNGFGLTNFFVDDITLTTGVGNEAPVASSDAAETDEDNAVVIDVLSNDSDADGDALTVTSVASPSHGSAIANGDGTITYTPVANFNGSDNFAYTIGDGNGGSDSATVSITVNPVNDGPVAADDEATTEQDGVVIINVLGNDSDVDGDALSVSSVAAPANGSAVLNVNNTVTYTPGAGFSGTDAFAYAITDGSGGSDTATVTVTVNPAAPTGAVAITNASYHAKKRRLSVTATSSEGDAVPLRMDYFNAGGDLLRGNVALSYNSKNGKWSTTVAESATPATVNVYFEGDMSVHAIASVSVEGAGGGNGGGPNSNSAGASSQANAVLAAMPGLASFDTRMRSFKDSRPHNYGPRALSVPAIVTTLAAELNRPSRGWHGLYGGSRSGPLSIDAAIHKILDRDSD